LAPDGTPPRRDVHVLLQHSDKSSARYASAGRLMFGLENDWRST
jgi:hypothetical protein